MNVFKISNFLSNEDFNLIYNYFYNHELLPTLGYDECGRKLLGEQTEEILKEYSKKILPEVRDFFNENNLEPSYALFAEYSNDKISLAKHKDANACTYTVDLVLYQNKSWGIWVDGIEYLCEENEALFFMGEDQEHWRNPVENNTDRIGVIFFHYVKPDHWWFTKGPGYVNIIRAKMRGLYYGK
jgi:hypothetical protein